MEENKPLVITAKNHRKLYDLKMDKKFKKLDGAVSFLFEEIITLRGRVNKLLEVLKRKNEEIEQLKSRLVQDKPLMHP